ncbi:L-rhamnose isomerase [Shigella flexneri]
MRHASLRDQIEPRHFKNWVEWADESAGS